jgi:hypothetical protein
VLPKPADAAINETRVFSAQRCVIEPEPVHRSRPEVLDQHICRDCNPALSGALRVILEVKGDAYFVAIYREVLGAFAVISKGRPPGSRYITKRRPFDLDYVGAKVTEHHRGQGACQYPREVDDKQACVLSLAAFVIWTRSSACPITAPRARSALDRPRTSQRGDLILAHPENLAKDVVGIRTKFWCRPGSKV